MTKFIFFAIMILIISIPAILRKGDRLVDTYLSPFGLFSLYFSFVYFFVPFIQLTSDTSRFLINKSFLDISFVFTIIILLSYYFSVFVGSMVGRSRSKKFKLPIDICKIKIETKNRAITLLLIIYLFIILISIYYFLPIMIDDYSYFMYNRTMILSGMGYLVKPLIISTPICIILLVHIKNKVYGSNYIKIVFMLVLSSSIFLNLLFGSRVGTILTIFYVIYYIMISMRGKLKYKDIFFTFMVLLLLLFSVSSLGTLRTMVISGNSLSVDLQNHEAFLTQVVVELSNSFGHTELINYLVSNDSWDLAYGQTFLAGFLMPVPRSLWEEKPVGGGPYLTNIINPGAWKLGKEGKSSFTTGLPLESFMNFGFIGIVIVGYFHGLLIGQVTRYFFQIVYEYQVALYIVFTFALSESFVTGEFAGAFVRTLLMLLPVVVLYHFSSYKNKRF